MLSWPCSSSLARLTFYDVELPPCRPTTSFMSGDPALRQFPAKPMTTLPFGAARLMDGLQMARVSSLSWTQGAPPLSTVIL